jgi:hypothetical protein
METLITEVEYSCELLVHIRITKRFTPVAVNIIYAYLL